MIAAKARSRYIPWLFVAGFALVVAVNGIMMWFAIGSFSGLYASKSRDRGLHYNEVIAAQKTRDALGWRVETVWRAESGRMEVAAFDKDGNALTGADAFVQLIRPAERRPPVELSLDNAGAGRFAGHVDLPARGNWDLDIIVERNGQRFALTRRMFLR